jgi:hypothetical protein
MATTHDLETGMGSETSTLQEHTNLPQDTSSFASLFDIEKDATPSPDPSLHNSIEKDTYLSPDASTEPNAEESSATTPPVNLMLDPSSYPDGGLKAWLAVGGAFCSLFVSFGM